MFHADENMAMTFEQLGIKLAKRFGFRELPETALVIFNNAMQMSGESLDNWADRVLTLASKAFRLLPEEYLSQQAILKFCQGFGLTHSAPRMFACIVPQALDVIKHCYSPARFTHTFLTFMELQLSRVLNQNGY